MVDDARKLKYPNDRVLYLLQQVSDRFDALTEFQPLPFTDETTRVQIAYTVNAQEFKRILSALLIGAEQAYPDLSHELFLLFSNPEVTMIDCGDVADCIEGQLAIDPVTNEPVNQTFYNTITNTINNTGFGNPNRLNPETSTIPTRQSPSFADTPISDLDNCDLDALWAWIRHGVVARLDDNARDMLEDLAALNDLPQRYQAFIDIVPVLGDLAEGIATAATEVIPDVLNAFNSYSSETKLDEISCEIFSLVCSECRFPTYEEIFTFYATGGYNIDDMNAVALANVMSSFVSMMSGVPSPQIVYHTVVVFQLFVLYMNATFNNESGTSAIAKMGSLGEDYANNNWLQLCETCNEQWQIEYFDFTQSPSGWKLNPSIGISAFGGHWVAGSGWVWDESGNGQFASITYDIDPSFRIRGVGFNYTGVVDVAASGITLRPTPSSNTGAANQNLSAGTNYNRSNCLLTAQQGYRQVVMGIKAGDANPAYIEKAFIVYDAGYGRGNRAASRAVC